MDQWIYRWMCDVMVVLLAHATVRCDHWTVQVDVSHEKTVCIYSRRLQSIVLLER